MTGSNPRNCAERTTLSPALSFTKGCQTLRIAVPTGTSWYSPDVGRTLLYDLQADPQQQHPINNPAVEKRMIEHLVALMRQGDAPAEQFERLGLK